MTNASIAAMLSLLATAPGSVFRTPVSNEGALEPAAVEKIQRRIDAQVGESPFDLTAPEDSSTCDSTECWGARAKDSDAAYVLDVRIDSTQADQRLAVTITDLAEGTMVAELDEVCELCGRTELEDLAADMTATALRKLQSHAAVSSTLVVDSVPAGAQARLDGVDVGVTPVDIEVTPGEHTLELSAEGHAVFEQVVDVERGTRERLRLVLTASTPEGPAAPADDPVPVRRRGRVVAGSALLGSGVAAVGAGIALLVLHGRPITGDCSGANVDADGDCHYLHNTRPGGALALGAGAAAAIAGGVMLGLEFRREKPSSVSVAPTPAGAVVSGRF